jgi:diguanylate cyclase (GGDEF)-like protein
MASGFIAKQATRLAQRTLLAAFGGLGLLSAILFATLFYFEQSYQAAAKRLLEAQHAADQVLLADERLTMSANMAAATGESRWVARYEANIPVIDEAIATALAFATPAIAQRFDAETRAANDRLVALERASFAAVAAGDLARARAILDSPAYAAEKAVLSAGAVRFTDAVIAAERAHLRNAQLQAGLVLPAMLALMVLGALMLWRQLGAGLKRSETAMLEAEAALHNLEMHDPLTGLANRRSFREQLRASVARADKARAKAALLLINIDHFKAVNEAHGQLVGDLVLKEAARRIGALLRQGEIRARYGADEFAVLIEFASEAGARRLCHAIVEALSQPMVVAEKTVLIGASIGVAIFPTVASCDEDLLRRADVALQRAKREDRGAVRVYDLSLDVEIAERMALESALRAGVEAGEITPQFQPLIDLRSGETLGFEILARWRHPVRGMLGPSEFLPLAERTDLMDEITASLLRAACDAARCMPPHVTLMLNLSAQQVHDEHLAERLLAVLRKTAFAPQRLFVDVSEQALATDPAGAKRVIAGLKAAGVRVALDDFGSAQSSFSAISELPLDAVKIDSSFVRAIPGRPECAKVVTAIVALGKSLGVMTIAENVETEAQANFLKAIGCDAALGFHFSKPLPAAQAALSLAPQPEDAAVA